MEDEFWKFSSSKEITKRMQEEISRDDDKCFCAVCGKEIDKKTSVQDWDGFLCGPCLDLREEQESGPRM